MKHVPEWIPGAGFKRKAREWRAFVDHYCSAPFDFVKDSMNNGTAVPSFTSIALRDIKGEQNKAYQEEMIKSIGATIYTGSWFRDLDCSSSF